jgi:hypothetical protein
MKYILTALILLAGLTAWADQKAEIRITADNYYRLWVNPGVLTDDGMADPGFIGASSPNDDWTTPETHTVSLRDGRNTILVRAVNLGEWGPNNPAGMIARIVVAGKTTRVSDNSWEWCADNGGTPLGNWQGFPQAVARWDGDPWYGDRWAGMVDAFSNSEAMWIWYDQLPVIWFRATVTIPALDRVNQHRYLPVEVPGGIRWRDALAAAEKETPDGKAGHLATVTSSDENAFITSLLDEDRDYWLGGYQPAGSKEPAGGWRWVTGESWKYTSWRDKEPSNSEGNENVAHTWDGEWNDDDTNLLAAGYVIEFDEWKPVPLFNPANKHYYQGVRVPTGVTWADAAKQAERMGHKGMKGHLATITSKQEGEFLTSLPVVGATYWLGGYQLPTNKEPSGDWRWITGSEKWAYTNWVKSEPNDSSGRENALEFNDQGLWNDRPSGDFVPGFIVEFEAKAG